MKQEIVCVHIEYTTQNGGRQATGDSDHPSEDTYKYGE